MTTQEKKDIEFATRLHEAGYSRVQIAKLMKIPNDKNLSNMIHGKVRDMLKRHSPIDPRLNELHEEFPCPVCYPQNFVSREDEDEFWEAWRNAVACETRRQGMWQKPKKQFVVQPKDESVATVEIAVEETPLEPSVVDVTNLTSKQQDMVADYKPKPKQKPISAEDTGVLVERRLEELKLALNSVNKADKIQHQRNANNIKKELKKRKRGGKK